MVNQIQKIAKEIKKIPTQDFRTEDFLQDSRIDNGRSFDEDSLLEELKKMTGGKVSIVPNDQAAFNNDLE